MNGIGGGNTIDKITKMGFGPDKVSKTPKKKDNVLGSIGKGALSGVSKGLQKSPFPNPIGAIASGVKAIKGGLQTHSDRIAKENNKITKEKNKLAKAQASMDKKANKQLQAQGKAKLKEIKSQKPNPIEKALKPKPFNTLQGKVKARGRRKERILPEVSIKQKNTMPSGLPLSSKSVEDKIRGIMDGNKIK